jgi:predicted phage baseplate assembly protein
MARACGCTTASCGCCTGTTALTPVTIWNRPGLPAVRDRVGTHGSFFETMKARLPGMRVSAPGADGQTIETFQPLQALTTREPTDPAIALLDGWATVADVLTFYQERITNEAYLRTATERGSLVALSRTVGYVPRPGVAATTFLWYTIDDTQADPVVIPPGARAQSVPGPGELPQSFETSDPLEARAEWNALSVRQSRPQRITFNAAMLLDTVHVAGGNLNLKPGDPLLFVFDELKPLAVLRSVASTESAFGADRTAVHLQPVPPLLALSVPLLIVFTDKATKALPSLTGNEVGAGGRLVERATYMITESLLGMVSNPLQWKNNLTGAADNDPGSEIDALLDGLDADILNLAKQLGVPPPGPILANPDTFVAPLLKPGARQPANALRLGQDLKASFSASRDTTPQLLLDLVPQIRTQFYTAWSNAAVATANAPLKSLHVLRTTTAPFGAASHPLPQYSDGVVGDPSGWFDWPSPNDEYDEVMFLEQQNDAIQPLSYVLIRRDSDSFARRIVRRVMTTEAVNRAAYGLTGKSTQLTLNAAWRTQSDGVTQLRGTAVRAQSEQLSLAEEPITTPIDDQVIELSRLYKELKPGNWLVLSGERTDIPGVTGVQGRELAMLSGLQHGYDATLPGDVTHTTLLLATKPAYAYRRATVVISANVVRATHGETRNETLGAGDATKPFQSFDLKQPPLTFVPATSPSGIASTLHVMVDNVEWEEATMLSGLGPRDRRFVTRIADSGKVTITFGNGVNGARLPTGVENVSAVYRQGIGRPGNVRADQVSMLLSRPTGVRSVVNPLAGSGGADPESADLIRENTALAVAALDRIVSLQDYADFARTFAGIAKADARKVSDGVREYVHVTIAGADDIPIDTTSDLFANLVASLQQFGDPSLPLIVALRERVTLVLSAKIKLARLYQWEPVVQQVRAAVLDRFGFARRALGQPALLSELISVMQGVPGVAYIDVDAFGGVPERVAELDGTRRLLTLNEIATQIANIVDPPKPTQNVIVMPSKGPPRAVRAAVAGVENHAVRPAQLAIFTAAVPQTMALNQIQ